MHDESDQPRHSLRPLLATLVATTGALGVALEVVAGATPHVGGGLILLPALLFALPLRSRFVLHGLVLASVIPLLMSDPLDLPTLGSAASRLLLLGLIAEFGHRWLAARDEGRRVADRDPLTGVFNSAALRRRVAEECGRSDRGGRPFSLVVLDCDNFKSLNDLHGHIVGDACLRIVASTLDETTRVYDVVGRMGGDEFCMLLPATDETAAAITVSRLRVALENEIARQGWRIGVSLGTATFVEPPESVDAALAAADARMYEDKRSRQQAVPT